MLPVANLHLRDLYETTVEFFALRRPTPSHCRSSSTDDSDSDHEHIPLTPRDLSPIPDPVDRLQKECADLRVKLHAAKARRTHCPRACPCRSLGASVTACTLYTMRREHDAAKSELHRSQVELARLEERYKMLEKTLKDTRELLRAREVEVDALRKDRDKLAADSRSRERSTLDRRRSQDIVRHRSNSSQSFLSQQIRLSADWSDHHDVEVASQASGNSRRASNTPADNISTVSEEERAHTKSMETFLTKTDLWSGAQVIQAVQDLNSEILQFAASAVELCTFAKQRPTQPRLSQTQNDVSSRLGVSLTRALLTPDHSQDPMLVQIALQGCISYCISRALSSFCIGYQSKANITLTQLYTHMFQSGELVLFPSLHSSIAHMMLHFLKLEPQPASSRWRALAHKHIHELHPELADYAVNEMTETIFRWAFDLFLICGSTSPQSNLSSREAFRSRFGSQVKRISKSACRIAQIIREEIMSTNFEVIGADSGRTFDAQEMVDAFEDYGTPKGTVLCTTELGLRCSTRKAIADPLTSREENTERRLLLRPKVILESAVDMLDQR